MIEQEAAELRPDFPRLKVLPVTADITQPFALPAAAKAAPVRVGFFPGSTIGNFEPHEAAAFLRNAGRILGAGATLIIGADLIKPVDVLNAAYNDAAGVTAKFNLNLLARINRELGGTFKLDTFEHHAFYNRERHRVEMHLASLQAAEGEGGRRNHRFPRRRDHPHREQLQILVESLGALARGAGWQPAGVWTDERNYFSIQAFTLAESHVSGASAGRPGIRASTGFARTLPATQSACRGKPCAGAQIGHPMQVIACAKPFAAANGQGRNS